MRVIVCIATFRRPGGLARALRSVAAQELDAGSTLERAIVVNNDPSDARPAAIVDEIARATGLPIAFAIESAPGPAPARNRALSMAEGACDAIAFLDDDEEAPPRWLSSLLRVRRAHAADVVTGPVHPRLGPGAPTWAGEVQRRPERATGTMRPWAFTHNVLFDAALLSRLPTRFDPRFRQGEDRHYFARLAATGARIVWCAEDAPHEDVGPERLEPGWHVRRMRAIGRAVTAIERDTPRARLAATRNLAKGLAWIAIGALPACWASVAGGMPTTRGVRARGRVAYGVGLVEGALGRPPSGSSS